MFLYEKAAEERNELVSMSHMNGTKSHEPKIQVMRFFFRLLKKPI